MDSTATAAFDLNLAVEDWLSHFQQKRRWTAYRWKAYCGASYRFRPDDLEELRSHLLDQIDDLMAEGQSAEQAFQWSVSQLGTPDYLAREYQKVHYWYTCRQKALAFSRTTVTSRRVVAFSMIFVAITFGSIFGQKRSYKHRPPTTTKSIQQPDTLPKSPTTSLHPFN